MKPAHRMTRDSGTLVSESTIRDAKTETVVPVETREHVGAGVVTWAKLGGIWCVVGAEQHATKGAVE